MNLQEFDRAIDNHRRRWKRVKYIAKATNVGGGECIYVLFGHDGREHMRTRWTPPVAESLREEYGWERAKYRVDTIN